MSTIAEWYAYMVRRGFRWREGWSAERYGAALQMRGQRIAAKIDLSDAALDGLPPEVDFPGS